MNAKTILKRIDSMTSYTEKLEYLNGLYLKAKTQDQENMIMVMLTQLKFYGK